MEQLLLLGMPIIVTLVTAGLKKINLHGRITTKHQTAAIRIGVAILSYVSAILVSMMAGEEVALVATETFVNAGVVFFASTGVHLLAKKKPVATPTVPTE